MSQAVISPTAKPPRRAAAFSFVFATALMNAVSFGIMIPILPNLIKQLSGGDTASASDWNVLFATTWGAMQFLCGPILGMLSDRFGRRPVLFAGCLGFLFLSWPALELVQTDSTLLVFVGLLIMGVVLVTFTSTMPSTLPALFPTIIRYGALAIAFNVSVSLFGGTTPLVTESLVAWAHTRGFAWANDIPAFYLMIAAVIGLVAVWFTKESANVPLLGSGPAVATDEEARELIAAYADESSEVSRSEWAVEFAQSGPIDIVRADVPEDARVVVTGTTPGHIH